MLRALRQFPDLDVHLRVLQHDNGFGAACIRWPGHQEIRVLNVEEKQTDVNLATYLTAGSLNGDFQQAALISNDADFVGVLKYLRDIVGIPTVVLNPNVVRKRKINRELEAAANYVRNIQEFHLAQSQLVDELHDAAGRHNEAVIVVRGAC